jgi:hypothetical protein
LAVAATQESESSMVTAAVVLQMDVVLVASPLELHSYTNKDASLRMVKCTTALAMIRLNSSIVVML